MTTAPGWYADPSAPGQQRYWDGAQWTEQVAPGAAPNQTPPMAAHPYQAAHRTPMAPEQARQWGMLAHLSALGGLLIGFSFIGPLIVYLIKKDEDAFVADQAREALNFNLSALLYITVGGIITTILIFVLVGFLLIPVLLAAVVGWLVLVIVAAVAANKGEAYRYPLTIRFISN